MVDHKPVLLKEVLALLDPRPGQNFVDGTFGQGGHARAILERLGPTGRLIVFDLDPAAVSFARSLGQNVEAFQKNFRYLEETIRYAGHHLSINGILFDLGMSSTQLGDPTLGLSFQQTGPLNMRLGRDRGMTAAIIVNSWSERELADLFYDFGEERLSRRIAKAVVSRRRHKPFLLTTDLSEVIIAAVGGRRGRSKIHPATRVFQALRIAVNEELNNLRLGISAGLNLLAGGGRLAVISFHSLEDRLVKQMFKQAAGKAKATAESPELYPVRNTPPPGGGGYRLGQFTRGSQYRAGISNGIYCPPAKLVTKKPVCPSADEVALNPRSRSAKLRVIEKI